MLQTGRVGREGNSEEEAKGWAVGLGGGATKKLVVMDQNGQCGSMGGKHDKGSTPVSCLGKRKTQRDLTGYGV